MLKGCRNDSDKEHRNKYAAYAGIMMAWSSLKEKAGDGQADGFYGCNNSKSCMTP